VCSGGYAYKNATTIYFATRTLDKLFFCEFIKRARNCRAANLACPRKFFVFDCYLDSSKEKNDVKLAHRVFDGQFDHGPKAFLKHESIHIVFVMDYIRTVNDLLTDPCYAEFIEVFDCSDSAHMDGVYRIEDAEDLKKPQDYDY
jgi:hypothetical protein